MLLNKPVAKSNSTFAKVSFFRTDEPSFTARVDAYNPYSFRDLGDTSLVGFEFTKDLGQPCGTIQITLTERVRHGLYQGTPWPELIKEGDYWGIDVVKNGVEIGLSMGRIDSVRVTAQAAQSGAVEIRVIVVGRTYGFALADSPVYWNPYDPAVDNALGIDMATMIDSFAGYPGVVLTSMIRGLMGGDAILGGRFDVPTGLVFGAGSKWLDGLDTTSGVSPLLRGFLVAFSAITPQGSPSVWEFVDAWRNPSMNEMFVDVDPTPGYPKTARLMIREKPFVNFNDGPSSPWYRLTSWNIDASTLTSADLVRGAFRVNHVQLLGDLVPALGDDAFALFPPVYNDESIRKYGLRRLEETTRYFDDFGPIAYSGAAPFAIQSWLSAILSWNCWNHRMWNGQLDIGELRPEIHVGQKVAITNGPIAGYDLFPTGGVAFPAGSQPDPTCMTFYVESVSHSYREGEQPSCTTTLTVSRGFQEILRQAVVLEEYTKFRKPDGRPLTGVWATPIQALLLNIAASQVQQLIDPTGYAGGYGLEEYTIE